MIKLQGDVSDPEDTIDSDFISRVLGTTGTHHKVADSGTYTMNIFMRLQQRNDL